MKYNLRYIQINIKGFPLIINTTILVSLNPLAECNGYYIKC